MNRTPPGIDMHEVREALRERILKAQAIARSVSLSEHDIQKITLECAMLMDPKAGLG
jgi:hypothetical protein